ncbi:MAG TPA: hypothetical protein VNJ08_05960 [Bacteriovoracaceae bacterium]|nr:hypothetical protein [Bacteriovoracaceae bacterium]
MEKKITKKFFLLSSLNLITALILGGGFNKNALALSCALVFFVLNHLVLVKIVNSVTSPKNAGSPGKILFLFFIKMTLLGGAVGAIYFYDQALVAKVMILMIFQLIIQVLSIKNNY